jgi:hypothetical protein
MVDQENQKAGNTGENRNCQRKTGLGEKILKGGDQC